MKHHIVILCLVSDEVRGALSETYEIHYLADLDKRARFFESSRSGIEIVLTNGTRGITAVEIEHLPDLKIVSAFGAGYENVDVKTLRSKSIDVTHGPGTNSKSVADHAMALLLASARQIVPMHTAVQVGGWATANYEWPCVNEKRMGIFGLGRIGMEIAKRAGGFDLDIGYHNRSQRDDVVYGYHDSIQSLAEWCDFLICAGPGGPNTHHIVNAEVLEKLGPNGIIVNIGRGSIIDTEALVYALVNDVIAGAGLDVVENEPNIPDIVLGAKNLVITPHIAGRAPESTTAKYELFLKNVELSLSGQPVATPVPED